MAASSCCDSNREGCLLRERNTFCCTKGVFICKTFAKFVCVTERMLPKFCKKNSHVKSGTVEKYRITSSLLAKNKIRELVFFADDAWFPLNRNLEGKRNR